MGVPQQGQGNTGLGGMQGQLGQAIKDINVGGSMGRIGGVSQQLQNFRTPGGLQQAHLGGLQGMINSGNPVDVSGITQAAQNTAGRTFQDLMGQTNEQFGAMNLGSSSARTGQLGRQAQNLAQGVGDTGLIAGVQAGENAANRQLGALGQAGNMRGQDLGALQGAGNLEVSRGGLDLNAQLGRAGAGQSFVNPFMNTFNQGMGAPGFGTRTASQPPPTPFTPPQMNNSSSRSFSGPGAGSFAMTSPHTNRAGTSTASFGSGRFSGGGRSLFQRGGAVPRVDQQDFMSNLLFGTTFNKPVNPQFGQQGSGGGGSSMKNRLAEESMWRDRQRFMHKLNNPRKTGGLHGMKGPTSGQSLANAMNFARGLTSGGVGMMTDKTALARMIDAMGIQNAVEGLQQSGRLFVQGGQGGAQAQSNILGQMAQSPGQGIPGRSPQQLGFQEGGFIDGPSVPPDTVPIMAQGGEGVLHVKLMHELEKSKSKDPLIKKMQKLMFSQDKGISGTGKSGIQKKASGGMIEGMQSGGIPTGLGNENIQALLESLNSGVDIPGLAGGETLTINDPEQRVNSLGGTTGVSELGVGPMSPEEKLQKERDDAARRVSLIRSAMLTGTKGSAESLAPFLAEAEGTLQQIDQNLIGQGQIGVQQQEADIAGQNVEGLNQFRQAQADAINQPQMQPSEQEMVRAQVADIIQRNFETSTQGDTGNAAKAVENAAAELRAQGFEAEAADLEARMSGSTPQAEGMTELPQNPTEFNSHVMGKMINGEDLSVPEQQASLHLYANLLRQGMEPQEIEAKYLALHQIVTRMHEQGDLGIQ